MRLRLRLRLNTNGNTTMLQPESLPENMLQSIIQHILHDYNDHHDDDSSTDAPRFYTIAKRTESATTSQKCPLRTRTLMSLMLTSRHLYTAVKPLFYHHILIPHWNIEKGRHVTWTFYECITRDRNPDLDRDGDRGFTQYIHSATLNTAHFKGYRYDPSTPVFGGRWELAVYESSDERGTTPGELAALMGMLFFSCPNLRRLSVVEFNAWGPLEEQEITDDTTGVRFRFRRGTSPVTHLTLANCGAKEAALTSLLSWPRALETLHYDARQAAWSLHYRGTADGSEDEEEEEEEEEEAEWTCAALVRALSSQKGTLRELTLTRQTPDCERMYMGPRINLSEFAALRVLRIYEVFLVGVEPGRQAWRAVPPNLEVLEVFYDDACYQGIRLFGVYPGEDLDLRDDVELHRWWEGLWLNELLVQRGLGRFPALKTVRVCTTENERGSWHGRSGERTMRLWELPLCIRDAAREADVHVEVWLNAPDHWSN
ncbi:hypothetical protein BJY00DRAFT_320258 [Aspergillus carlsbadensis]|nr:hypothetical protein BJY00DRAFT_320258 [Aspergillus carlsbadensis]